MAGFMTIYKKSFKAAVLVAVMMTFASQALAQNPTQANQSGIAERGKMVSGPRKQLATIIFAGLGGAILGLSTLSFYGRPQEKLNNIAIGGAIGIMAGTVYVTYKAATNPSELYGQQTSIERELDATRAQSLAATTKQAPLVFNYSFEF